MRVLIRVETHSSTVTGYHLHSPVSVPLNSRNEVRMWTGCCSYWAVMSKHNLSYCWSRGIGETFLFDFFVCLFGLQWLISIRSLKWIADGKIEFIHWYHIRGEASRLKGHCPVKLGCIRVFNSSMLHSSATLPCVFACLFLPFCILTKMLILVGFCACNNKKKRNSFTDILLQDLA